jgi:hypothetical protein
VRYLPIVVALLALAVSACARGLEGSSVELLSPASISPGQTYTFEFSVQNASPDNEWIADVRVTFPDGYVISAGSMSYVEIVPGRPAFDMLVADGPTAVWEDGDGSYGEIWDDECCRVSVEATVAPQLFGVPIYWCLQGDIWGDPPHESCGSIDVRVTPVEASSWSAIKSLYN